MTVSLENRLCQLESAKKNLVSEEVLRISKVEEADVNMLCDGLLRGEIVIPSNRRFPVRDKICGIGKGLTTKVNANIGTSGDIKDLKLELDKLRAAVDAGCDAVMDLSTGGDLEEIRKAVIENSQVPVGTVPVYDVISRFSRGNSRFYDADVDDFLQAVDDHGRSGVDFVTVHAGVTLEGLRYIKEDGRIGGIVSRGGSHLAEWMSRHKKENPYFENFDALLDIALKYDLVLSLGDGLRPGALKDASDRGQIHELMVLGELQKRAFDKGVQVMIEGPGHVPIDQIKANVMLAKKFCSNAPFYVLGPLVTDVAPGYDHISGAIGGALAASYGADFLCYVTPAEHLRLPAIDDVKEGVIASRIAAHSADLVKYGEKARRWDDEFSRARKKRDWEKQMNLAIDKEKPRFYRQCSKPQKEDTCTMCGEFCSYKLNEGMTENDQK